MREEAIAVGLEINGQKTNVERRKRDHPNTFVLEKFQFERGYSFNTADEAKEVVRRISVGNRTHFLIRKVLRRIILFSENDNKDPSVEYAHSNHSDIY